MIQTCWQGFMILLHQHEDQEITDAVHPYSASNTYKICLGGILIHCETKKLEIYEGEFLLES